MRQMMQRRYDLDWECDILSVHEFRRFRNVALYVSLMITLITKLIIYLDRPDLVQSRNFQSEFGYTEM